MDNPRLAVNGGVGSRNKRDASDAAAVAIAAWSCDAAVTTNGSCGNSLVTDFDREGVFVGVGGIVNERETVTSDVLLIVSEARVGVRVSESVSL